MDVNFNYPLDNALIQATFVKDTQCPKDFDGHLQVDVTGDSIGISDAFEAMNVIKDNNYEIKVLGEKSFQIAYIKKADTEHIFNNVIDLFEDIYWNSNN